MTVRRAALQFLTARWPEHPETLTTVLERSYDSDDYARKETLQALWLCWAGRDEVSERLVEATRDPSEDVRSQALKLLTRGRPEHPAIPQLLARARRDANVQVRQVALTAQGQLSGAGPSLETASLAQTVAAAEDADVAVRKQALTRLLLKWPNLPETFRAVQVALHDGEYWVTVLALAGLLHRWPEDPRTRTTVDAALGAPDCLARHHAMLVLANTGPDEPATQEVLAQGLRDPHWWVRKSVVQHIARLWPDSNPNRITHVLIRACRDEDATVRSTALARLGTLYPEDPATLPAIAGLTCDTNAVVRRAALEALLILRPGDPLTTEALHDARRDPDADIRTLARDATGRRNPGRTRDLHEVVRDTEHGHWTDRAMAVDELATRWPDTPDTLNALRHAAADDSGPLRQRATETLAQRWWDEPGVDSLMLRMAVDDDGGVRMVAIKALSNGPDRSRVFAAVAAAAADAYWAVRIAAMKRLVTRWSASNAVAALLRKATGDPDWYVRHVAISLLRGYASEGKASADSCDPSEDVRQLFSGAPLPHADHDSLAAACDDPDHVVHLPSLTALIAWWPGHPGTQEILTQATRNPCPGMRHLALSVLLQGTDEESMAQAALEDPAPEIRMLGLAALHRTGRLDRTALARLLADKHPDIVEQTIELCPLLAPSMLDDDLFKLFRVAASNSPYPWPRAWIEWRGGRHAGL
jgi:HEAT repeat protein